MPRRSAEEILRVERPTSITLESAASSTRTTLQSQAIRSTVLPEIGSEYSIPAAQLDQRIRQPLLPLPLVLRARLAGQRLQRLAHRRPARGVQKALDRDQAVAAAAD